MKSLIKLENVSKQFGDKRIFDQLNLEVFENEIVVIMGGSGAGKSTLLNLIAQLDDDYKGKILYSNEVFDAIDIPFPFVFQEFESLLPWKTVEGNLKVVQRKHDLQKVHAILKEVELFEHKDKYPHELSGGMKQRVGIARALLCRSKILLMDEPFGSLDGTLRTKLQLLIKTIQREHQLSILFVTHDEEEAQKVGDRIIRI